MQHFHTDIIKEAQRQADGMKAFYYTFAHNDLLTVAIELKRKENKFEGVGGINMFVQFDRKTGKIVDQRHDVNFHLTQLTQILMAYLRDRYESVCTDVVEFVEDIRHLIAAYTSDQTFTLPYHIVFGQNVFHTDLDLELEIENENGEMLPFTLSL